jgi:hypothetical protein
LLLYWLREVKSLVCEWIFSLKLLFLVIVIVVIIVIVVRVDSGRKLPKVIKFY